MFLGSYSGKSSLISRRTKNKFLEPGIISLGLDFKPDMWNGQKYMLVDTPPMNFMKSVCFSVCKNVHAFVLMYDVTDPDALKKIKDLYNFTKFHSQMDHVMYVVGNKIDLDRVVTIKQIQELVREWEVDDVVECSAKTGVGVTELFEGLYEKLRSHKFHSF